MCWFLLACLEVTLGFFTKASIVNLVLGKELFLFLTLLYIILLQPFSNLAEHARPCAQT